MKLAEHRVIQGRATKYTVEAVFEDENLMIHIDDGDEIVIIEGSSWDEIQTAAQEAITEIRSANRRLRKDPSYDDFGYYRNLETSVVIRDPRLTFKWRMSPCGSPWPKKVKLEYWDDDACRWRIKDYCTTQESAIDQALTYEGITES